MRLLISIKNSVKFFVLFTLLLGFVYPMIIYTAGQIFFRSEAEGSLYYKDGKAAGSFLLGQKFTGPGYFHPRPSSVDYDPDPSGASNLSQTSGILYKEYIFRKKRFIKENHLAANAAVPEDMLFSSASGVDPDISHESAYLQAGRIIKYRNFDERTSHRLYAVIDSLTRGPQLGIFGDITVNVLKLNIKLDELSR